MECGPRARGAVNHWDRGVLERVDFSALDPAAQLPLNPRAEQHNRPPRTGACSDESAPQPSCPGTEAGIFSWGVIDDLGSNPHFSRLTRRCSAASMLSGPEVHMAMGRLR